MRPQSVLKGIVCATLLTLPACGTTEGEPSAAARGAPETGAAEPVARIQYGLVIHGGAGTILRENMSAAQEADFRAKLEESLRAGHAALQAGGEALDAVTAAINVMEDSPLFNAGKGAVFTHDGRNALDAAIMDGARRRAGAVAGLEDVKNPIDLARLVMEESPHVMLAGRGAEQFAREHGIPSTPADYFFTQHRWDALQRAIAEEGRSGGGDEAQGSDAGGGDRDAARLDPSILAQKYGTVGAVALDRDGRIAAGTSTGGMTNKRWDRIGDVPIIGAGTYAEANCGVSTTGWGEYFIRNVVAYDICARMRYTGASLARSARAVIHGVLEEQQPETGGAIALSGTGDVVWALNSPGMYRGYIDQAGNVTVEIFQER